MAHSSYQLHIAIREPVRLRIGALGELDFPAGHYVYTGSARRNLQARIARHRRRDKRLHWHIDHLLAHPAVRIIDVATSDRGECAWHQATPGWLLHPGFGAGDCCGGHLLYVSSDPSC